ncbi:MAG: hypothetical protein ACREV4_07310 [Gammaproteobacteria bacterium]
MSRMLSARGATDVIKPAIKRTEAKTFTKAVFFINKPSNIELAQVDQTTSYDDTILFLHFGDSRMIVLLFHGLAKEPYYWLVDIEKFHPWNFSQALPYGCGALPYGCGALPYGCGALPMAAGHFELKCPSVIATH